MDKIVNVFTKPAKMIAMILLFAAAGFGLIVNAASIGGGFMPVVGGLIYLAFDLAFWAVIPVLYVMKKDNLVKYALAPVFGFWIISTIYSYLQSSALVTKGYGGITIASGLFRFIIALALLAGLVLSIVYLFKKEKKFIQIAFCIVASTLLFFVITWALRVAFNADWGAEWDDYFALFQEYLFLPFGLVFAVLAYLMEKRAVVTEVASPEVNIEEVPAQNVDFVKEAAATEEPVESTTEKTEVAEESTKEKDIE